MLYSLKIIVKFLEVLGIFWNNLESGVQLSRDSNPVLYQRQGWAGCYQNGSDTGNTHLVLGEDST